MTGENQFLLELKNFSVNYVSVQPLVRAVDDIGLKLIKNETLGIIGESGCGKSSLALGIMGLIKQAEVKGEVIYKGQNLNGLPEKEMRKFRWKEIALVFQNSLEVLNPVLTVGDQIGEPIKIHYHATAAEIEEKVIKLMEKVHLDSKWRHAYPHQLSGGMRQRVLVAMALSCNPELLIVDEPTTALDVLSKNEILQMLQQLQKEIGFTMVIISHDLGVIKKLTNRVAAMYCGRIIEKGLTSEVLKNPLHCYTRGLLNSSPNLFKYKDLWGIEGEPSSGNSTIGCAFYPRCCQHEESCSLDKPSLEYVALEHMVACHKGGIETFLSAANIRKTYKLKDMEIVAVKDASMEIKSGEIVALVGESGSGKSTLAQVLAGVWKSDKGEAFFKNKKLEGHWATKMMGGMQIVFQDPFSATSQRMKVIDIVKEPLDIIKWGNSNDRDKAGINALRAVQLPTSAEFQQRYCHALSGGQRQRLAIARALVTKPKLLIADEVTSMLDPSTQANLLRELKGLQNRQGFAMLYITHDMHLARKVADKVYVMYEGEIVEHGVSGDIFKNPKHIYTKQLMKESFRDLI
ncbi:dipeptide ABC transporter ATP-binding protein [Acetobacterium woodii]|uniref:Nickel import system ATP-binding protein NikD n=1 Tax=Acetobacterium woodii (strain ATCC 29683 / DSM 1030 / JCM 2381 / KCTC 1655 / WB1) TaxID=931626 RepID=H6LIC0_ACEWD|nr:ABC transporter ATP-binding protein [Acetobacterium woodii]AFA47294.1 gluthation ABC transport system ATP-binding protein GsiA [Acetobacterium woodii DSM 1030]